MPIEDDIPSPGRRRFLWTVLCALNAVAAGLVGVPVLGAMLSPLLQKRKTAWIRVCPVDELPAGKPAKRLVTAGTTTGYGGDRRVLVLWVSRGEGSPVALSAECTHMGCLVDWSGPQRRFECPCHGGTYDASGAVVAGPPPRPLERLPVVVRDGHLWVRV